MNGTASATTAQSVRRQAWRDALGLPSLVLLTSMTGFGALARVSELGLGWAWLATAGIWGLPGQLAMVELYVTGTGLVAIAVAVGLANARFLPMAVSFMPLLANGLRRPLWLWLLVQLMSINSWVGSLRAFPTVPIALRRDYYVAFALQCLMAGLLGTGLGYMGAAALPDSVTLGLIFLNPVFFAIILAGTPQWPGRVALLAGAFIGPPLFWVSPDWGLLLTGVVGGTVAFLFTHPPSTRTTL